MTREFWLWLSAAFTCFCNGFMDGLGSGMIVGGGGAYLTDTTDSTTITWHAAVGFALGLAGAGVHAFVVWRAANPMPNPFFIPEVDRNPPLQPKIPHQPAVVNAHEDPDKLP